MKIAEAFSGQGADRDRPMASLALGWVALLYFNQGFPFGLINEAIPVYFRFLGVSLQEIGLMSLVGLPWTLKFLWAPAIDAWGTRKRWMLACQASFALLIAVIAGTQAGAALNPVFWFLLVMMAAASATQDIAIDAYAIDMVAPQKMGLANGLRVTFYRAALVASGGLLVAAAGPLGWRNAFALASVLMAVLAVSTLAIPKSATFGISKPQTVMEAAWIPLRQMLNREGFWAILLFVLLFKIGDLALAPMSKPFWVDRKFSPVQIGLVPGTVGILSTILGALLGGYLTNRLGIFRALWSLGLFQAVSNLVYAGVALAPPSNELMYAAVIVEAFCGGLGTASFLSFLMSICEKNYVATQFALLTAIFGLSRSLAGAFSGFAAQKFGYSSYFAMTFLAALPAFALLPWIKPWIIKGHSR